MPIPSPRNKLFRARASFFYIPNLNLLSFIPRTRKGISEVYHAKIFPTVPYSNVYQEVFHICITTNTSWPPLPEEIKAFLLIKCLQRDNAHTAFILQPRVLNTACSLHLALPSTATSACPKPMFCFPYHLKASVDQWVPRKLTLKVPLSRFQCRSHPA